MTTKSQGVKILPRFFIHIYLCNCTIQKRGSKNTPIKKTAQKRGRKNTPCLFCVIFNRVIIQFNYNVHV